MTAIKELWRIYDILFYSMTYDILFYLWQFIDIYIFRKTRSYTISFWFEDIDKNHK